MDRTFVAVALIGGLLFALPGTAGADTIPVTPATGDKSASNNDYDQIENAVSAANSGDEIVLDGTFNWSESNAMTRWQEGNDGVLGNADDWSIQLPINKLNVTIRGVTPGGGVITGPGDLTFANLEGVFVADGSGDYKGWTFRDLRIEGFDLSIGMFNGAGGSDAYEGVTIADNFIRVPTDLNATVAPDDVNQNIGVHYSSGKNQTISGNTIQITGSGVSDGSSPSSSVGMQSNTSGGDAYDGLLIEDNVVNVTGAQAAEPASILGIWENGHAHLSDISVSGNEFNNLTTGGSPATNLQRAFRVTSHSGPATIVTYEGNVVDRANTAFQWLAGTTFASTDPVRLVGNEITDSHTGVLVQSNGQVHLLRNEIVGSGTGDGVHVASGALRAITAGGPSVSQNVIADGDGDGLYINSPDGNFFGPVLNNDLSGNAGLGVQNDLPVSLDVRFNWWGSTDPAVVYPEIGGTTGEKRPHLLSGDDLDAATPGFQGDLNRISIDQGSAPGDGSPDSFSLQRAGNDTVAKAGATTIATGQFTEVRVHGTSDDDTLTVDPVTGPVPANSSFLAEGGDDLLTIDDSPVAVGETYTVAPGSVTRGSRSDSAFSDATERVVVEAGTDTDSFDATPSADTIFELNGNDPSAAPGDSLTYRAVTRSPTRTPDSGPDGQWIDTGVQAVEFTGIEEDQAVLPPPPPTTPAGDTSTGGGTQTPVLPDLRDLLNPVAGGLRLSPARIARRGRRARPIPRVTFTLSEAASVQLVLQRKIKGRRVGTRCSTRPRTGRRCTILRRALPVQTVAGKQGANSARLSSRVRRLARGDYRLSLVATDAAGNRSAARTANLKIIR
jgi:hypothetical protein